MSQLGELAKSIPALQVHASGRPMRGLVGYVIIDPKGTIRVQRVDIDFGAHAGQILEIVGTLNQEGR